MTYGERIKNPFAETKVISTNGLFARNLKMASGVAVPKQQPADSATGYHPVG